MSFIPFTLLDRRHKGFPPAAVPCRLDEIGARHWNVLAGDLPFPIALLRDSALRHNIAWMQEFARARGIDIAPHGKTTMSPELYRRQLAAGAWGISFATVYQLAVGAETGITRALIANQVVCDADLDGLAALLQEYPALRVWFLVDSVAAAIAEVPFVDVLNTMQNPDLPLTVTEYDEWGDPNQPDVFARIKGYAPYENVRAQGYPAILAVAGYNDSRVQYWEAAKWVARLRELKTDGNLLLLKTDLGAGHGGMSGRYQALKDVALEYAFLFKVLGVS